MLSTCSEPMSKRSLGHVGDELALADARLELLGDQLVGAVDHRARRVEQHDLVDRLDLARIEHHLLAVADQDPLVASSAASIGGSTMSTPSGMSATPSSRRIARDLLRGAREQAGLRRDGAAQADHARRGCSRAAATGSTAGGACAAEPKSQRCGIAAAGQQRVAGHLVPRPLADVGAGDVADVVEVEQQDRAEVGRGERLARAPEPVGAEPVGVDRAPPSRRSSTRARRRWTQSDGCAVAAALGVSSGAHRSTPARRSGMLGASMPGLRPARFR